MHCIFFFLLSFSETEENCNQKDTFLEIGKEFTCHKYFVVNKNMFLLYGIFDRNYIEWVSHNSAHY